MVVSTKKDARAPHAKKNVRRHALLTVLLRKNVCRISDNIAADHHIQYSTVVGPALSVPRIRITLINVLINYIIIQING